MNYSKSHKKPNLGFKKPGIMGILNVTPDSFSDGGKFFKSSKAIKEAIKMSKMGADIIDIGAESTRPGAKTIKPEKEIARLKPILKGLINKKLNISVDTRNSITMKFALDNGVKIINDVSALNHDPESINVIKDYKCHVILMHMQGEPKTMQNNPKYKFAPLEVYNFLKKQIKKCEEVGIKRNKIIIDPGIGFGKTSKHNIQILQNLSIFNKLGCNVLIGLSRKRFISDFTKKEKPADRIAGTIAANQYALENGADIIRVHDVKEALQAKLIWQAIKKKIK